MSESMIVALLMGDGIDAQNLNFETHNLLVSKIKVKPSPHLYDIERGGARRSEIQLAIEGVCSSAMFMRSVE